MPRIGLVHALRDSMPPLDAAFARHWPDAVTTHLFDSSLYVDRSRNAIAAAELQRRIAELLRYCASTGAEAILFTGSFFGAQVEAGREGLSVPVLTSYDALVEAAFSVGRRFAVVSTAKDSAPLLTADLRRYGERHGLELNTEEKVAAGAMEALFAGEPDEHDRLIAAAAASAGPCDAVLLAQFSMARAAERAAQESGKRILTAPETAVLKLKSLLGG